jgi:flagellar biosynthesis protein FliP
MLMVPPMMISLPIKILMFVLIDGWNLVVLSLLGSFS